MHPRATANDRLQDMLRHFPTMLARWAGAEARVAELTRSHPTLRIELRLPDRNGYLLLACVEPSFIQAPTVWQGARLTVELLPSEKFALRDSIAGLHVVAGKIEIKEIHESNTSSSSESGA
jgi:hypothetical protein